MADEASPKRCIVEGPDTSAVTLALMRRYAGWARGKETAPVFVYSDSSIQRSLKPTSLDTEMKASGRLATGIIVDAEQEFDGVWSGISSFISTRFDNAPLTMPHEGLILCNEMGKFGVWIMPDNQSDGMLEDFVNDLVPDQLTPLWRHAADSVSIAREKLGAPCKEVHLAKAHIHTWLAFLDPPGQRLGNAIDSKALDPNGDRANAFVSWFRKLFEV